MNVLEKILEEIDRLNEPYFVGYIDKYKVKEIVRSHIEEVLKCGECSRRKWYQKECEDGKKDNGWISVEERLPEKQNKLYYDICIVTLENGEVCLGVYRNAENEWWTRKNTGREVYTNKRDVAAWQPLPTRYIPPVISKRAQDLRDRESFFTE